MTWLIPLALAIAVQAAPAGDGDVQFFESRIRPVLVQHCYECHSHTAKEPKGALLLDWRDGIRKGGKRGPAVVPGDPGKSLLVAALRHESLEMPPGKRLPDGVIADFVRWIEAGAADPREAPPNPQAAAESAWRETLQQRSQWWSLQPVVKPAVPTAGRQWSQQPIDRFIAAGLQTGGLQPSPPADRTTLARRLSYLLLGLPPDAELVEAFVNDPSPAAYETLVDRLLASPHFGERWARHWMDVVRYTDTYGYEWDIPAKGAWRYRDYLIRAFNDDVPFDQLVREQIAGDLLEEPRINKAEQINESVLGTMFFQMGEKRHGDSAQFNGIHQEMLDNKIDAFSKALQAMTVACARCHDHKLDAVAQHEYYALAGVFMSSRWVTNTADLPGRNARVLAELESLKTKLRPLLASLWLQDTQSDDASAIRTFLANERTRLQGTDETPESKTEELPLEDPLHLWQQHCRSAADGKSIAQTWQSAEARYAEESKKRASENATHFKLAVDFRQGVPGGWSVDGEGLRKIAGCGDFTVALQGEGAVGQLLPGGLCTNALSPRLNGAVRTPYLSTFDTGHISFEVAGGDFAAHRTVIDNAFLTERQAYVDSKEPAWTLLWTHNALARHVYIEFATKSSNPNFPPRAGLGGECTGEQIADPRSWFGLTRVVVHEAGHTPVDELARFSGLFEEPAPATLDEAAGRYARWFNGAIQAWADDKAGDDDVRLINWLLQHGVLTNRIGAQEEIDALVSRYRATERRIAPPWTINGMADLDPGYDYRLNIRGDYDQLGDAVHRGYLAVLCNGNGRVHSQGSGRRELAERIAAAANPLTARVMVNRVWQWLFGTGLVATPNDFGHLGERPSHPELLDYLTVRFKAEGWSIKRLVRSIVLSQTWRQSGQVAESAQRIDPANRLLHHYPLRRLEAEAIRDGLLAVSGRLDLTLYGPPIDPYRANEDPQKRLFSGPLDGKGRRSIYTKVTIMEPPRFLSTFNQPDPKIPTGKRDVTNTPAQSLTLLNDPLVVDQAAFWARRVVAMDHADADARLIDMFRTAFGREPREPELTRWKSALADLAALRRMPHEATMTEVEVWQDVAHAMFNAKEFIYVR